MKFDEEIAIEKARENKVVKDNQLIQNITRSKFELTATEQKMVGYIVSMIKPREPGQEHVLRYEFDIRHFCKICGIDFDNGANYAYIKDSLKKLRDKSFWITDALGDEVLLSWIESPKIHKRSGKVGIRISEEMIPYLYDLQARFTSYELYQILALKSTYSIRLYELLASYAFTGQQKFSIEDLKRLIQCPHKEYKDLRRYAIEPAVKEINEFTNLVVTWEPIKNGRRVDAIKFTMTRKKTIDSYEAYRKTLAELNGVNEKRIGGQLNLFEFME
ncbi:MAG: replication initiation protein [Spirochaetaceae bacterium]|nr:replication initiation protein [Spirochaetaceae bacterium]